MHLDFLDYQPGRKFIRFCRTFSLPGCLLFEQGAFDYRKRALCYYDVIRMQDVVCI